MSATDPISLPTYIKDVNEENYHEEFNQTARYLLSTDGWSGPASLTTAQATALSPNWDVPTFFFNTDLKKLQVLTAPGVIETITSA
jgi:hypothetical protein